jgi:hypothetical protein
LDLQDIRDDLVVLKNGSCCVILTTNAINFGLLSEPEQDATIYAYAAFLNSLNFPIQILIRSEKKDISSYLQLIKKAEEGQKNPLLQDQTKKYLAFVEKIVKENQVLEKIFYIIIPFSFLELGAGAAIGQPFKAKKSLPYPIEYILEKAKMDLYPKRDHLIGQFGRLGLRVRQLNNQEIMELFYQSYNPESMGQKFSTTKSYSAAVIATNMENNAVPNQPLIKNV